MQKKLGDAQVSRDAEIVNKNRPGTIGGDLGWCDRRHRFGIAIQTLRRGFAIPAPIVSPRSGSRLGFGQFWFGIDGIRLRLGYSCRQAGVPLRGAYPLVYYKRTCEGTVRADFWASTVPSQVPIRDISASAVPSQVPNCPLTGTVCPLTGTVKCFSGDQRKKSLDANVLVMSQENSVRRHSVAI